MTAALTLTLLTLLRIGIPLALLLLAGTLAQRFDTAPVQA
jgi:hypothetical protein